jgi:hypothetical protein
MSPTMPLEIHHGIALALSLTELPTLQHLEIKASIPQIADA